MKANLKMTRLQFSTYIAVAMLLVFAIINRSLLISSSFMYLILIAIGIFPFLFGVILQAIFYKIMIPYYIAIIITSLYVLSSVYLFDLNTKFFPEIAREHQDAKVLLVIFEIILYGVFINLGLEAVRKIRIKLIKKNTKWETSP